MDLSGKTLALLLWSKDEDGEDDVAVFKGSITREGASFFYQNESGSKLELTDDWLGRIVPVASDVKDVLLNCDYQLSLTVGQLLPDSKDFVETGLSWPE
ncbi:TPA: hypothetical protein ACGVB5_004862 [Vibrio vulnificus]|nr:hypothetical protein [Vibrio vulnificus]HDY8021371.1 hypothetical protein [Vibrio vulnificus]HDY8044283.1 hypothetical protein [Vibrio vulnificus]